MFAGVIASPQIFSRLIILFFNPSTIDDVEIRQSLSIFFPAFAFGDFAAHSIIIESSFMPTLKTVSYSS